MEGFGNDAEDPVSDTAAECGRPAQNGRKVWCVTFVEYGDSVDGKARVLGLYDSKEEAHQRMKDDAESYMKDLELEVHVYNDSASVGSTDEVGCEYMIEKVSVPDAPISGKNINAETQMEDQMVRLGFKRIHPNAKMPRKAHKSDAGMDVCAVEATWLKPFRPTLVKTGLVPDIPDRYELQVRPRSGLALKNGVTVWNSPGTVDAGYKGEIGVIMLWTPQACEKDAEGDLPSSFVIGRGDRIAQLVLAPVVPCSVEEVDYVGESDRSKAGHFGFGSTGV